MVARTGSPDCSSSASHRSEVSVLAWLWRFRYAEIPAWNVSSPRYCSSMRSTEPPFW